MGRESRRRKRMARAQDGGGTTGFAAANVAACWRIARRAARAYQREANLQRGPYPRALCLAARNAADRIALKIRFGKTPPHTFAGMPAYPPAIPPKDR